MSVEDHRPRRLTAKRRTLRVEPGTGFALILERATELGDERPQRLQAREEDGCGRSAVARAPAMQVALARVHGGRQTAVCEPEFVVQLLDCLELPHQRGHGSPLGWVR